ncbi:MAG: hypothetical protein OXR66_05945 [Candidatus Woesearchaeota archaeon]|nr:hypothetical protein [Candidatus Woesearchaeota archaeon]
MKKFTKADIDGTRDYFRSQKFDEVEVTLGERTFTYFVLPQEMEPALPNFVFRSTGNLNDGYVFGISDSVPVEFRKYAVAHEYIEFAEIGIEEQDRCVRALTEELQLVPSDIKSAYIHLRAKFFRDLVSYCEGKQGFTENDIAQFRENQATLEGLIE